MNLHNLVFGLLNYSFAPWSIKRSDDFTKKYVKKIKADKTLVWDMAASTGACSDHIETAGFLSALILCYGRDAKGYIRLNRHLKVPTLRKLPDDTGGSFGCNFTGDTFEIYDNGEKKREKPHTVEIRGTLKIISDCGSLTVTREFFAPRNSTSAIERVTVQNKGYMPRRVKIKSQNTKKHLAAKYCAEGKAIEYGSYTTAPANEIRLDTDEQIVFWCVYYGVYEGKQFNVDCEKEYNARKAFVDEMFGNLRVESGYPLLDAMFSHCVLRGSESIYETSSGLMHGPGGGNYYAALWTNDQCEYANPFFPYSGYSKAIEQSVNCYKLYEKYMDKSERPMSEKRALVTSIVAQGRDFWNGAKDRGDGSMYAYGCSRFLLAQGDKALMKELFGNLCWCIDFALSRKSADGIIKSDSDELENRFESSDANLNTSCLTYDALLNCARVAEIIGETHKAEKWLGEREKLGEAIECFFGRNVKGYETYRYYDGNTTLRSWICMPLTVGIKNRAEGTLDALFSEKLYNNGLLRTDETDKTTWDRSLLFALRGAFISGGGDKAFSETLNYCKNRLTGFHSPYPFEAFPEGNMAHLAAESILFARIITEGMFGLSVTGYRQMTIKPNVPESAGKIALRDIRTFGEKYDVIYEHGTVTLIKANVEYKSEKTECTFDFNENKFI